MADLSLRAAGLRQAGNPVSRRLPARRPGAGLCPGFPLISSHLCLDPPGSGKHQEGRLPDVDFPHEKPLTR